MSHDKKINQLKSVEHKFDIFQLISKNLDFFHLLELIFLELILIVLMNIKNINGTNKRRINNSLKYSR